jgi:hypothetical protein
VSATPEWRRWADSAVELLGSAVATDDVSLARQAFQFLARAESALPEKSLVDAPEAAPIREQLRRLAAADDTELMARTAANVTRPLSKDWPEGLRDALLGRSGYQLLQDMGTWTKPPLSEFHLADVDDDLADATEAHPLAPGEIPAGLPASHTWWWPPLTK